ncbi:MAG: isochorismate synthase MenF [Ignavibacteriaceae bacterium]
MEDSKSLLSSAFIKFTKEADFNTILCKGNDVILSFLHNFPDNLPVCNDNLANQYTKVFYYADSRNEYEICSYGECFSLEEKENARFGGRDEERIRSAESELEYLSEIMVRNWTECCSEFIPLFTGGMKFNSGGGGDWSDYSASEWFLPETVIFKTNQTSSGSPVSKILFNFLVKDEQEIKDLITKVNTIAEKSFCFPNNQVNTLIILKEQPFDKKKDQAEWRDLVDRGIKLIRTQKIQKVVFSRLARYKIREEFSVGQLVYKIKQFKSGLNGAGCNGYIFKRNESVFWGCSPEKLFSVKGLKLETEAVAGSISRGNSEKEDRGNEILLLTSKKNLDEHNYVIDFIVATLKEFSSRISFAKTPRIKKTAKVQHLWTPITAELKSNYEEEIKSIPIFKLIYSLFPTPAVCGHPREKAFNAISKNENIDRGLFTGIVGWFNFHSANITVAIRGGLQRKNELTIYAGCGIVEDSDAGSEYEETILKMKNILTIINYENKQ